MDDDQHFDDYESVVTEVEEEEKMDDFDDEDYKIDDYDNQNREIDDTQKEKEQTSNDDDNIMEFAEQINFEDLQKNTNYIIKKRKSNIEKISKYEESTLIGKIATFIEDSKLDVPEQMLDEEIMASGNAIKIAFFWYNNRQKYPIPLSLKRSLNAFIKEEVDPNKLKNDDDYFFEDDYDDTNLLFHQNFRPEPYQNNV
jgi:hypothetical protein